MHYRRGRTARAALHCGRRIKFRVYPYCDIWRMPVSLLFPSSRLPGKPGNVWNLNICMFAILFGLPSTHKWETVTKNVLSKLHSGMSIIDCICSCIVLYENYNNFCDEIVPLLNQK